MHKYLAGGFGAAAAIAMVFGPGSAGAVNEFNGMTYAKAQQTATAHGNVLILSTKTGSYLDMDDCMVVGTRKADFLDSSGRSAGGNRYLIDLNCNDLSAQNGHPGNSAATPEGKQVMEAKVNAEAISKDYAKATEAGKTPACFRDDGGGSTRWCVKVCTTSKSCSAELSSALGL